MKHGEREFVFARSLRFLPSQLTENHRNKYWLLLPRLSRSVVWTWKKTTLAIAACFDTDRHPHCRC